MYVEKDVKLILPLVIHCNYYFCSTHVFIVHSTRTYMHHLLQWNPNGKSTHSSLSQYQFLIPSPSDMEHPAHLPCKKEPTLLSYKEKPILTMQRKRKKTERSQICTYRTREIQELSQKHFTKGITNAISSVINKVPL